MGVDGRYREGDGTYGDAATVSFVSKSNGEVVVVIEFKRRERKRG